MMSAPGGVHDGKVVVAPWQSLDLDEFGLTEADVTTSAYWAEDGELFPGHLSTAKALEFAGGKWAVLGWFIAHPPVSWVSALTYAVIAKNRHRLPGSTDSCKV